MFFTEQLLDKPTNLQKKLSFTWRVSFLPHTIQFKNFLKLISKFQSNSNLNPNLILINLIQIAQLITYTTLTYKLFLIHLILTKKYVILMIILLIHSRVIEILASRETYERALKKKILPFDKESRRFKKRKWTFLFFKI